MEVVNPYDEYYRGPGKATTPCYLHEGLDMIFFYDKGSTTRMFVSIEKVSPLPPGAAASDFPRKVEDQDAGEVGRKRARIDAMPQVTRLTMDEALPFLHERLVVERGVRLDIGRGSGFRDKGPWATIWGGCKKPAYQSSLNCEVPFENMDEALYCFNDVSICTDNIDDANSSLTFCV